MPKAAPAPKAEAAGTACGPALSRMPRIFAARACNDCVGWFAGMKCLQLKRHRIGGLDLPKDLPVGRYRELKPHDVRSVSDQLAQDTLLFNKVNRIASSGLAVDVTKKEFKASL